MPTQTVDAVSIDTSSPRRVKSTIISRRTTPTYPLYASHLEGASSAEDVSTTSDSDAEHDYTTDLTTLACSDSCGEDMQPDDVEDFRDREYPQLKGKTYMDHGGTTVCIT